MVKKKRDWLLPIGTVAALVLLLTGVIPWSLWWLLMPLWIAAAVLLVLVAIYLFLHALGD